MTDQATDSADNVLSKRTTPTWDMELLISGATTIGLLQLPGLMDEVFLDAINRSADEILRVIMPLWTYAKFALFTLIATFVMHLCLRGYWIALVGMNSVYPGGVRWNNLKMGPHSRAISEKESPAMAEVIEAADNRATRVFGLGFGMAMVMLMPVAIALLVLTSALLARHFFHINIDALKVFAIVLAVVILPWALLSFVDRQYGDRFAPDHWLSRAMRRLLAMYSRVGIGRRNNLLLTLYTSHEGAQRASLVIVLAMVPIFAVVFVQSVMASVGFSYGDFDGLPDDTMYAANSAQPEFYDSSRNGETSLGLLAPFIPNRVVRGPYLELFVPYLPRRHTPAMQRACPDALAEMIAANEDNADVGSRAAFDCLARLHDIQLDGLPVAVTFDASADPKTGQRGMLAMIPVRDLAAGRHELSVAAITRTSAKKELPVRRYRIIFWK